METRIYSFRRLVVLVGLGLLAYLPARAHEEIALLFNRGNPPVEFAAKEIRLALEAKGDAAVSRNLGGLAQATNRVCIVLAAAEDEVRQISASLGLKQAVSRVPQAYGIRKQVTGAQTAYIVLGVDAVGTMYGGVDVPGAGRLCKQ